MMGAEEADAACGICVGICICMPMGSCIDCIGICIGIIANPAGSPGSARIPGIPIACRNWGGIENIIIG